MLAAVLLQCMCGSANVNGAHDLRQSAALLPLLVHDAAAYTHSVHPAGEHMDQFESFETKRFVSRLLGKGDLGTLIDRIQVGGRAMDGQQC